MHWPPWRADPETVRQKHEAKALLDRLRAQRPAVEEAAERLAEGIRVNHLREKAFALREKGDNR